MRDSISSCFATLVFLSYDIAQFELGAVCLEISIAERTGQSSSDSTDRWCIRIDEHGSHGERQYTAP